MMKYVYDNNDNNIMITEGGAENEDFINVTFGRSLDESHEKLPPINEGVSNINNSRAENQTCINEVYNKRRSSEYYADQDNDRR